jgi:hypothetical protein
MRASRCLLHKDEVSGVLDISVDDTALVSIVGGW